LLDEEKANSGKDFVDKQEDAVENKSEANKENKN